MDDRLLEQGVIPWVVGVACGSAALHPLAIADNYDPPPEFEIFDTQAQTCHKDSMLNLFFLEPGRTNRTTSAYSIARQRTLR